MAEHYLRQHGAREKFDIEYSASQNELMKHKVFGDRLATIFKERKVAVNFRHQLISVDGAAKKAVFQILPASGAPVPAGATYEKVTVDFEFLHFVPPMSAPDFVKNSVLADTANQADG